MKTKDIIVDAFANTFRNKVRTGLTVTAVFVGAFTLALTNSIGAGVSTYIDNQIGSIGSSNTISVSNPAPEREQTSGPREYVEKGNSVNGEVDAFNEGISEMGFVGESLSTDDLNILKTEIDGVNRVEPVVLAMPTYIEGTNGDKYVVTPNPAAVVAIPDLVEGKPFTETDASNEIIIPDSFVEPLGFKTPSEAVGATVSFGVKTVSQETVEVSTIIVGVSNKSLFGDAISMNTSVSEEVNEASVQGLPEDMLPEPSYISAILFLPEDATAEDIVLVKDTAVELGFEAETVSDQIGVVQSVINGIVGVLNAFAVIALIAAGFGIVNTLLMSIQERTREIGLMKAMGMPSRKIYALFSFEALSIGLLGSIIGIGVAYGIGQAINSILADTLLAELPGLTLSLFTIPDVLTVVAIVLFIAFIAGTIPASKAAKQNPIDALRYE